MNVVIPPPSVSSSGVAPNLDSASLTIRGGEVLRLEHLIADSVTLLRSIELARSDLPQNVFEYPNLPRRAALLAVVKAGGDFKGAAEIVGQLPRTIEGWMYRFEQEFNLIGLSDQQNARRWIEASQIPDPSLWPQNLNVYSWSRISTPVPGRKDRL